MNDIKVVLSNNGSHIKNEDYFPLSILYDTMTEEVRHAGFYKDDDDLLEIAVAKDSGEIKTIQITICHHYSVMDSCFDYSDIELAEDDVCFQLPDHIECPGFNMIIYKNSIVIKLANITPVKHIKCGQVLFGIDDANNIGLLVVTSMTESDIDHTINELSLQ